MMPKDPSTCRRFPLVLGKRAAPVQPRLCITRVSNHLWQQV